MARATYGGSPTDIIGSIGGWTFQHNVSGKIIRCRPGHPKFSSYKQCLRQGLFFNQIGNWQNLTYANQVLWNAFASLYTKENPYGETKTLTGFNWFTALNCNLINLGGSVTSTPPAYLLPAAVGSFSYYLNGSGIHIDFDVPYVIGNDALFIYTTPPIRAASTKQRSKFILTKVINAGAVGNLNIKADWQIAHSLLYPALASSYHFRIAVLLVNVRIASGIMSPGAFSISQYTSVAGGIGYMSIEGTFIIS